MILIFCSKIKAWEDKEILIFIENAFDRKRRIAYYYPQRSYNFVAFDDSDEGNLKWLFQLTGYG